MTEASINRRNTNIMKRVLILVVLLTLAAAAPASANAPIPGSSSASVPAQPNTTFGSCSVTASIAVNPNGYQYAGAAVRCGATFGGTGNHSTVELESCLQVLGGGRWNTESSSCRTITRYNVAGIVGFHSGGAPRLGHERRGWSWSYVSGVGTATATSAGQVW